MAWFSSLDATVQVAVITICGSVSVAIITGIFGLIKKDNCLLYTSDAADDR